jgi:hypothetical protein
MRNDPHQRNEPDEIAQALAEPSDPRVVLGAIEAAHAVEAKSGSEDRG